MPLFAAGVTTESGDKTEEWMNQLVGKTLSETDSNATTFCKKNLPEGTRIIEAPNAKVTKDLRADRLNVYVSEDGIVSNVTFG